MWVFFGLVTLLIFFIVFCVLSVEWSMHLCVEYWNDRQYRLWKIICGLIGGCFLVAVIFLCVFSTDRFSDSMIKITIALVISAFIAMGIFLQTVHLIAWKNKCKILEEKIKKTILDKSPDVNKVKMLDICLSENKEYFTEKQIKRSFGKVYSESINKNVKDKKQSNSSN